MVVAFHFAMHALRPLLRVAAAVLVLAQAGNASAQGIYTCVDAKGRKITADRPIPDCIDREQQELNRSGTVLRKLGPTLTAKERAVQEEKDKAASAEKARQLDEKRRERALLLRYPDRKIHDRERNLALAVVDDIIASSQKRTEVLNQERAAIDAEMEFYVKDPSKAPQALKSRLESNISSFLAQREFVITQAAEKARLNRRFDEELLTLKPLWARAGPVSPLRE